MTERRVEEVCGLRLACLVDGGEVGGGLSTVLFVHGSGNSGLMWRLIARGLRGRHRTVALDLPGSGRSSPPSATGRWDLSTEGALLATFAERMNPPLDLVGHSYGGRLVLEVALRRPELVRRLVLIEPGAAGVLRSEGELEILALLEQTATDFEEDLRAGRPERAVERFVDYWNGPGAFGALPGLARRALVGGSPKIRLEVRATVEDPRPLSDYAGLDLPVLLLCGGATHPAAASIARHLRRMIPGPKWYEVPGASHTLPLTHPDAVLRAIEGFLGREP